MYSRKSFLRSTVYDFLAATPNRASDTFTTAPRYWKITYRQHMAGCLDNCRLPDWECFEHLREKRNAIASCVAGTLFAIGWWIIADAAAAYPDTYDFPKAFHTAGVFSTLGLIMVNAVSNSQVRGDTGDGGCLGSIGAKIWFFTGFILSFGSLIASAWILFQYYVVDKKDNVNDWPGIAVFLQNTLIFFSAVIFKFGRSEDLWE